MPIKRLVQDDERIAFPRLGVLRKGGEKRQRERNGKPYEIFGEDLDHFRFDTDDESAAVDFTRIFGDEPRSVRVVLPYPTMEQNFSVWQEAYTAGALQHRCDGETCTRWLGDDGKYHDDPVPCPALQLAENDKNRCKPVGRLMTLLPDLRRLAHVVVLTHAINDIVELQRNLLAVERWRGDLRGIVWTLSRKPVEISTPNDKGGRTRREKWLLFMEPQAEYAASLLQATTQAALGNGAVLALPDGRNANTATGEIVEVEAVPALPTPEPFTPERQPPAKHRLIERITELWRDEAERGGETPIAELEQRLPDLSVEQLTVLGQTIKARIAALPEAGANYEPIVEVAP